MAPSVAPSPTKVLVTQTTMATLVSTATQAVSVPVEQLMSGLVPGVTKTLFAEGPECTGAMGNVAICVGRSPLAVLNDLPKEGGDGKNDKKGLKW